MFVFASYGLVGGIGSALATRIDSIMVSSLVDFSNNGAYNIGAFIANVIAAPLLAILAISAPIISSSWEKNDLGEIKKIYRNASNTLLSAGIGLFLIIIVSIDDLVTLFPDKVEFNSLFWVVLFLGLAKLCNMAASVNNEIILYSKYFRFNLVAILILGILNIAGNYFFIRTLNFGMLGAAISTSLSLFVYNSTKLLFIYTKLKMQPFDMNTLYILLLGTIVFFLGMFLPIHITPIVNILIKVILVVSIYFGLLLQFKIAPNLRELYLLGLSRLKSIFNNR